MAVDVSKIPNNNKFDPVREAILKLQSDIQSGVSGVGSINNQTGLITITKSGNITVGTSGTTITIGIDDSTYLTEEVNDLTAAVTWANVPDANITQSSVTQHQASLSITESQISDLQSYLVASDLDDYLLLTETGEQTIAGDIVISGDLTVSGETTYINTNHLNIGDNIIQLNADIGGTTAPTEDAGFYVNRGSQPDASFLWDEDTDRFSTYANGLSTANLYIGSNQVINSSRQFIGSSTISSTVPYFTFSGDLNTGVGRATNNKVSLIAEGTKVLEASDTGVEITGDLEVSGTFTADSVTFPNDIITSADFSATDNRFKLTLTQSDSDTIEASFDDVVLSSAMDADYIPYVSTAGGDGDTTNAILSQSWLKFNSDTLELGASDPVSHEVRYARFLWQSGSNDKVSTVYGARDISATINYLGGSAMAKIAFTTGTGAGRIRFNDEFSFPATDGTSGQVLTTDGSGDLSWADASGGGDLDLQDVTDNGASTTDSITVNGLTSNNDITTTGNLFIGTVGQQNWIAFSGTTGDGGSSATYTTTYIGERIYGGTERSELIIYKGNDGHASTASPDRIRMIGANLCFDTYNIAQSYPTDLDGVAALSTTRAMTIDTNQHVSITNGNLAVETGVIKIGATTVIDSSRNITANSIIKSGGTSSQFLKADGSVDSNTYALSSHNHDDRYYTELEIQTFFDRGYLNSHSANNLAVGWYTIATNTGDRALAEFQIWDTASSDHQSVLFNASHHFGTDTSNDITVLANSRYSGTNFRYIRIKDGGTYDGAALQVYIDGSSNSVYAAIVGGNAQSSGWQICDWVPDATTPPNVSNYSSFGVRCQVDLDQVINGGIITTGEIYSGGTTAQYRVLNTGDEGSGNGLDADTVDGLQASQFLRSDVADTMTGTLTIDTGGNSTDALVIRGAAPTISFIDDDTAGSDDFYIHVNSNNFYVLRDTAGANIVGTGWDTPHPLQLEGDTNIGYLFGNRMLTTADEGSGNGLDADTLDGKQPPTNFGATSQTYTTISSGGWALPTGSSVFSKSNSAGGVGDDGYWFVLGRRDTGGGYSGIYAPHNNGTAWLGMSLTNSANPTWYKLWTEANDGAGSNLDADKVDGLQASQFLRSDTDDTMNGVLTILDNDGLVIRSTTNGTPAKINFSDHAGGSYAQNGTLKYVHSDGASYGSGNAFIFESSEATTTLLADGKLMFKEGLYLKPSSGTGGGTQIINSSGTIYAPNDIYVADQIIHTGDTNTYMQFHAADQWRVVTGGAERLEVNNTRTTINQPLVVNGSYALTYDKIAQLDSDNVYVINDSTTVEEFYDQIPATTGAVTKVSDADAPAEGCFEISGRFYSDISSSRTYKVDQNSEYTFEMWVKYVSGSDTDERIYAGWGMFDSSMNYFGNTQRYWGASGIQVDANSNNAGWYKITGTISGVGGSTGQFINGTKYVRPVFLFDYPSNNNTIRICGLKLYRSEKRATELILPRKAYRYFQSESGEAANSAGYCRLKNSGGDVLRIQSDTGYIDIGSDNSSYGHITTDRASFYFNKKIEVDTGVISSYNEDVYLQRAGTTKVRGSSSYTYIENSSLLINGNNGSNSIYVCRYDNPNQSLRIWTDDFASYFQTTQDETSSGYGSLVFVTDAGASGVYTDFRDGSTSRFRLFMRSGDLHADGDVIAFSSTTSDIKFKDDVVTIDNALDKVKALRGVEYTWNNTSRKGQRDLGFIAQEVEQVLPDIVREKELCTGEFADKPTTSKTVDYEKVVAVLVEAMKEQQKQIDELKARLDGSTN